MPLAGETVNDGVFSLWNGQCPMKFTPLFLREMKSPTTSSTRAVSKISCMVSGLIKELQIWIAKIQRFRLLNLQIIDKLQG